MINHSPVAFYPSIRHIGHCCLVMMAVCLSVGAVRAQVADVDMATDIWLRQMFPQKTDERILPEFEDSYGVVFRDLNADRFADLYVVRFRDLNRLFIYDSLSARYIDYTIESGLGGNLMTSGKNNLELGASAADANNDGTQDVLIVGWGETATLFLQQPPLAFTRKYQLSSESRPIDGNAGVWADIDLDGDLDLFITDEHYQNHLFINDGLGQFQERAEAFGVHLQAISQGASFADLDGDGYADLYVANWYAPDILYRNNGGTGFSIVDVPLLHFVHSLNTNGVSFGDIDNDGDLDILVTDRQGGSRLYENGIQPDSSAWRFTDITNRFGIDNPYPAYSSIIADLDNDGFQDIYFSNIGPNLLFLNENGSRFRLAYEQPISPASNRRSYSTGAAVADYDRDGDLDLFIANKDTLSALHTNPLNRPTAIRIRLEGVHSNRDAIGSKVWFYGGNDHRELKGYREISGGAGYLSISETIAHFGTRRDTVYSARIRFPSGEEKLLSNLRPGDTVYVSEIGGFQKTAYRVWQYIWRSVRERGFLLNSFLLLMFVALGSTYLRLAIRRYRWQNLQTALFVVGAFIILYGIALLLPAASTTVQLLFALGALIAVMIFVSAFSEKIFRLEQRRQAHRRLLADFSQQLIFIKDNDALYKQIVSTIFSSMGVNMCALYEVREATAYRQQSAGRQTDLPEQISIPDEFKRRLLVNRPAIDARQYSSYLPGGNDIHLALPIARENTLLALLLLGHRSDPRIPAGDDIGVLQILIRQAAIAIENNQFIEETRHLTQQLTESKIRERYVYELEEKNERLEQLYRELQDTQAQLIQTEKMAGLGQMVAGVAHELNNPISFVYANMKELKQYIVAITELLDVLKEENGKEEASGSLQQRLAALDKKYDLQFIHKDIDNLIEESLEGSQRVKTVVQNLRNFSRLDEADMKAVDLHEGLDSTLLLLNNELKNRITVIKHYGELPKVLCNPGHINQVFMNLIHNAAQAISHKGEIHITTAAAEETVTITIRDSGHGIPPEIQGKIFDPFFTTKTVGEGTGLGLTISYNIIRKHGGSIHVNSSGNGSEFIITLPIHR